MINIDWSVGKRAMANRHRSTVQDHPSHSADIDTQLRDEYANEPRWDYVLRRQDGTYAAVEVHPAKDSEVASVIRKKRWAGSTLTDVVGPAVPHTPAPWSRPSKWHWVATDAGVSISKTGSKRRSLAAAGIEFPTRRIASGRL